MMPSHSMDLPVPRGTSMLMLGGKFTSYGTKKLQCRCTLFVSRSKYVLFTSFCFSPDGKSSCTRCKSQAASQITLNLKFFEGILVELNAVIFYLSFEFDF